jgi:hypothetical protein
MGDANLSEKYLDLLKSAICASLYIESAWRLIEGPMGQYLPEMSLPRRTLARSRHLLLAFLRRRNLGLVRTFPFDQARRDNGLDGPMFGFSMTGRDVLMPFKFVWTTLSGIRSRCVAGRKRDLYASAFGRW